MRTAVGGLPRGRPETHAALGCRERVIAWIVAWHVLQGQTRTSRDHTARDRDSPSSPHTPEHTQNETRRPKPNTKPPGTPVTHGQHTLRTTMATTNPHTYQTHTYRYMRNPRTWNKQPQGATSQAQMKWRVGASSYHTLRNSQGNHNNTITTGQKTQVCNCQGMPSTRRKATLRQERRTAAGTEKKRRIHARKASSIRGNPDRNSPVAV